MALNYVDLTLDLYDGRGNPVAFGTAILTPTATLTDTTDHQVVCPTPISVPFSGPTAGTMPPQVKLLATDNSNLAPTGWAWTVTPPVVSGVAAFSFFLPYASGASQYLSAQVPVVAPGTLVGYLPLAGGTVTGPLVIADSVTFGVPAPAGVTATDTANVSAAIAKLTAAGGNGTLQFADGTYQVDSNALVIRNCSNFSVKGNGGTVITQAPNRTAGVNNVSGNVFTVADCTDFRISDLTIDGLRDTVAPLTPLTATAASGQPSVTVAAGQGSRYLAGQYLGLFGGLGSSDQAKGEGSANGPGGLIVQSITPGGGSGGGDLITFTTSLANSYTQISPTALSDGFGPYAYAGAYLTPYQTGITNTVAGRSLKGEDQQNGLHLLNCTRFQVSRVTSRGIWESGIKMGTGFAATSLTDGCTSGVVTSCIVYHGYDQGVSVWVSSLISVIGNTMNAAGWSGCSLTSSDNCTVVGNKSLNSVYAVPASLGGGNGIACEGGSRNQITGNIIQNPYQDGLRIDVAGGATSWAFTGAQAPTLSNFEEAGTVAGTSIQVSSTTHLTVNAPLSIIDGVRTERINIASVVDGTHITLSANLRFSHPSGSFIYLGVSQDNVITSNTVIGPQFGNGILHKTAVRGLIKNNSVSGYGIVSGSTFSGVALNATAVGPGSVTLGGNGTVIEGNDIGGGTSSAIQTAVADHIVIVANTLSGTCAGTPPTAAINAAGLTDGVIDSNRISEVNGQGIELQASGGITPARVTITGNEISRCANEGIIVLGGDSLTITGNAVTSCGGHAGINPRGVSNSVIANNVCNSNNAAGIQLEEQVSTGCSSCRVIGNTARDDGSGSNMTSGATWTQQNGIIEVAPSNGNLFLGNEVDANASAQLTVVGGGSVSHYNIISGTISG